MPSRKKTADDISNHMVDLKNSEKDNVKVEKTRISVKSASNRDSTSREENQMKPEILQEEIGTTIPETISQSSFERVQNNHGQIFLGGGLFVVGVILLLGNLLKISFGEYLWPFIFIVPGLLVFLSALSSDKTSGEGLAILGAILFSFGFLFFLQSITGLWATWAYIWALVAPTSIGFAQIVYGDRKGRSMIVESGIRLAKIGIIIFAAGFIFFEMVIGISGFGLRSLGLPVIPSILIIAGVFVLIKTLLRKESHQKY
jgi:hypothetical protein